MSGRIIDGESEHKPYDSLGRELTYEHEVGWLIEHRPGCTWWDGRSPETFTPDRDDCVWFARKEDAERVLANVVSEHNRAACIVTEHVWCVARCTCDQNDSDTKAYAKALQELHEERQRANDYLKADDIKRETQERTKAELAELTRKYLAIADAVAAECESSEQLVNIARATRAERDKALTELAEAKKDIKAMTCWRDCECETRKMEAERDKAWAEAAAMRAALSDYHQVSHTSAAAEKKERALAGTAGRDLAERVKRLEAVATLARKAMWNPYYRGNADTELRDAFAALDRGSDK